MYLFDGEVWGYLFNPRLKIGLTKRGTKRHLCASWHDACEIYDITLKDSGKMFHFYLIKSLKEISSLQEM